MKFVDVATFEINPIVLHLDYSIFDKLPVTTICQSSLELVDEILEIEGSLKLNTDKGTIAHFTFQVYQPFKYENESKDIEDIKTCLDKLMEGLNKLINSNSYPKDVFYYYRERCLPDLKDEACNEISVHYLHK